MRSRSRHAVLVVRAEPEKAPICGTRGREQTTVAGCLGRPLAGLAAARARWGGLTALLLSLVLLGCATWRERQASITGTVTCRQLVSIPTNAVVEVRLVERSGGQAVLAETRMPAPRQWPIHFVLKYDPKLLTAGQQCAVQGGILVEGKPWMVTDTVNHFMEWDRITHAEIILRPAR